MSTPTRVMRYPSRQALAEGVAQRLVATVVRLQAEQGRVDLCLTGGRILNEVYRALATTPGCEDVTPHHLHVWWGDDRFVPTGDPRRNSLQSLPALAKAFRLDPSTTHPMPAADGKADPDEAAYAYAQEVGDVTFDLCLLGMGVDGHVASLFPDHPGFDPNTTAVAVGVTDSPKPPPERISLTLPVINRSTRVWVVVSGTEKAEATARALGEGHCPGGRVHGTLETAWWTDQEAAVGLPRHNCSL